MWSRHSLNIGRIESCFPFCPPCLSINDFILFMQLERDGRKKKCDADLDLEMNLKAGWRMKKSHRSCRLLHFGHANRLIYESDTTLGKPEWNQTACKCFSVTSSTDVRLTWPQLFLFFFSNDWPSGRPYSSAKVAKLWSVSWRTFQHGFRWSFTTIKAGHVQAKVVDCSHVYFWVLNYVDCGNSNKNISGGFRPAPVTSQVWITAVSFV